jgi:hypothetical protein
MKCKLCEQASRDLITHPAPVCRACVAACCSAFAARDREVRAACADLIELDDATEFSPEVSLELRAELRRAREEADRAGVSRVVRLVQ